MTRRTGAKKAPSKTKRVVREVPADPADRMRPPHSPTPPREQTDARFELVRNLVLGNVPRQLIHQAVAARVTPEPSDKPDVAAAKRELGRRIGWPFAERQTLHAYVEIRKEMAEAFEADQPHARAVQSARLERDLLQATTDMAALPPDKRGPLHHAKARYHELLTRVQGTQAPTEIRVDPTLGARQTLIAVIMGMGPEEQARLVEEERARMRTEGETFPLIDERKESEPG